MTEFANELRRRCRNPKCRMKLRAAVGSPREAFCCRGCYNTFYLHRCHVCECAIEQPKNGGQRLICKKARCRNAWRARSGLGRYLTPSAASAIRKTHDSIEVQTAITPRRAWRIVAGPQLTAAELHYATVGAEEALEASRRTNARHWRDANIKAEARCLIKRNSPPVNVIGGYRFADAPEIDLRPAAPPKLRTIVTGDGLDIPDFLRRPPPQSTLKQRLAA
jgi:hypothetical protein